MAEAISMEKMYKEIIALRKEVQFIKSHMNGVEVLMTPDEEMQLAQALEDHKKGKTKRFEDIKRELYG